MGDKRIEPCYTGECTSDVISCWHTGQRHTVDVTEWGPVYLALSWSQWAWKIGEELVPKPIAKWMKTRRKAKKKRLKTAQKRREARFADAVHNSG